MDKLEYIYAVISEIRQAPCQNILDIGCDNGNLTIPISQVYPKAKVTGIDVDRDMLREAKVNYKKLPNAIANLKLKKFNGKKLPFDDASFDVVYSVDFLDNISNENKEPLIREVERVLQQGGIFRFQFTESVKGISRDEVMAVCEYAGFALERIDTELIEPNWVWVTAVKT